MLILTGTICASKPPPAHTPDPNKARPPPPPTTLPPHIHQLVQSLLTRFQDLESYQIPQLAQCRGPLDFHHELAQAVRSELAGCRRDLDELKLEVDDLEKAKDRLAAADHVNQVQLRLDQCTKQYRQAVVQSKRQIDASTHLFARDELLSSGASQSGRDSPAPYSRAGMPRSSTPVPGQSADDALMSATSDVTEGLRRTLQLMQQEVDRSLVSNELLESQTQTMSLTSTQYSTFSTLLTTSKSLITSLERADVLDRLLLFGAFAFFVAVCAHIFKKRVLDRGIKVAGALAGVVEKGGRALAGGAGGKEAGEVVKREVTAEVARAAATATAVAGALKAGVTGLAERARAGRREDEQERGTEVPFEEIVQPSPAEPIRTAAAPVEEPPSPIEAEEPIPIPHEPIDHLSDEGAAVSSSLDPLPAESTEIPHPPSSSSSSSSTTPSPPQAPAQATVATSPAEPPSTPAPSLHDAQAEVEEHDEVLTPSESATQEAEMPSPSPSSAVAAPPSDADSASAASTPTPISASPFSPSLAPISSPVPSPSAAAEPDEPIIVAPRQPHPPEPSLSPEEVDELLFETPAKPDLAEVAEAEEREEEPEHTKEADEEKVFHPLATFRPTRPDLDPQLADSNALLEENAIPVTSPLASSDVVAASSVSVEDAEEALPEPTTMPLSPPSTSDDLPPSPSPPKPEELLVGSDSPADSPRSIALSHEAQNVERDVAGVEGTTIPLDTKEVEEGTVPALDVKEEGLEPAAAGEEQEQGADKVELPIDLEKEQTRWDPSMPSSGSEPPVEPTIPDEEHDHPSEEQLLDEMLEQSMGGLAGVGYGAIGGITANETVEAVERAPEAVVESEQQETEQAVPVAPEAEVPHAEEETLVELPTADELEAEPQPEAASSVADLPREPTSSPSFSPSDAPASVEPSAPAPTTSQADATLEERLAPTPESTTSPLGSPEPVDDDDDDEVPPPSPSHETSGQIASEEPLATPGPAVGDEAAPRPSPPTAEESGQVEEPIPSAVELAQPEPVHESTEEPLAEQLVADEEPLPSSHVEAAPPSSAPEEPASTIVSSSDIAEEQAADSIVDAPTPVPAEADELHPSRPVQTGRAVFEEDVAAPPASVAVAEEALEPTAQLDDEIAAAPAAEPSVVAPPSSPASAPPVESPLSPSESPSGSPADAASPPLQSAPAAADDDEDDLPNSSHVYPPSSVEDVPSATQEEDLDASAPGVFEEAAQEAVEGHVGEGEDEGLVREAEERLHELEEEGGGAEEFATDGKGEGVRRDEL
ncbi:hypothetical protein JCM5296_003445 [Sporobolomyces johnsonii]